FSVALAFSASMRETVHDAFAACRVELVRYGVGLTPCFMISVSSPTDDLTEATIGDWFDRTRAITRRLVPRSDFKDDLFDDLFFSTEDSQGMQPDGDGGPPLVGYCRYPSTKRLVIVQWDLLLCMPDSQPGTVQESPELQGLKLMGKPGDHLCLGTRRLPDRRRPHRAYARRRNGRRSRG
ncbi:hypothetical protein FOL47_011090, partial [Perkinsus chesapeaki]